MIARKTFREIWPLVLAYLIVMQLITAPAIYFWPDFYAFVQKSASPIKFDMFERLWNAVRDASPEIAYRNYFALMTYFRAVNVCGIAAAVLIGTGSIARERENQTLEFLLARPISRSRILFAKYWVSALGLVIPIFLVSWFGILLSSWLIDEKLPFIPVTVAATHSALFVLMILNLTFLLSAVFRTQVHAAAAAGTLIVMQVTLYFDATLRKISLFKLADFDVYGPTVMGNRDLGQLMTSMGVWMLLACAVMYAATDFLLRRIDL